jgi:hypothetical protein
MIEPPVRELGSLVPGQNTTLDTNLVDGRFSDKADIKRQTGPAWLGRQKPVSAEAHMDEHGKK